MCESIDSCWTGDTRDQTSMGAYLFVMAALEISWGSCKQTTLAPCSFEEEHMSVSAARKEDVWHRQLLMEVVSSFEKSINNCTDGQKAIDMARNVGLNGCIEHIDVTHHFVRNLISHNKVPLNINQTQTWWLIV